MIPSSPAYRPPRFRTPYMHSPGVGTQPRLPRRRVPYVHSPGIGTQPNLSVVAAAPPAAPRPSTPPTPPTPDYLALAQKQAQAQIDPILRNIADQYNAMALASRNAISALTSQYAARLGQYASGFGAPYSQAINTLKGLSKGVSGVIAQAGQSAATTESGALAAAHLPATSAGPDVNPQGLAAGGKGAAAAAGAIGQALIDALAAEQKAALTYAGKLPGFATQEGQQQTNLALASLAADMAKQMASTTAQIPQLTYQIYQDLQNRANQDKTFAGTLWDNGLLTQREYAQKIGLPDWQKYPALTKPQLEALSQPHKIAYTTGAGGHRLQIDQTTGQVIDLGPAGAPKVPAPIRYEFRNIGGRMVAIDPITAQRVADLGPAGTPKAPSPGKPIYRRGSDGRTYVIDPKTNTATPVMGMPATTTRAKSLTPQQLNNLIDTWYYGKPTTQRVQAPHLDKNGNPVIVTVPGPPTGQLSYQQAYQRLRALGVPDDTALRALDTRYARGERGRPWLAIQERQALASAGLTDHVHFYNGDPNKPYLEPAQVRVLKAAGTLPAGTMVKGRKGGLRYIIKPGYAPPPNKAVGVQTAYTAPVRPTRWPALIAYYARKYGVDPNAALAVASVEGLSGGRGDQGTSAGPFQLHRGGALPGSRDYSWAESPAGIEYAMRQIASVARGLSGEAAVRAIVERFERPADPASEVRRALAMYGKVPYPQSYPQIV